MLRIIYMHGILEVQIECTCFLVSDLENRVTLTEVTLDGVSLLLTEFRNDGKQILFVCFYLSYILRQLSSNQLIIQSIVAQSLASINAKMEDMASSIQRLNETTEMTETTGNYIRKYTEHQRKNYYYYSLVAANNMNINICSRTTINPNSARCM